MAAQDFLQELWSVKELTKAQKPSHEEWDTEIIISQLIFTLWGDWKVLWERDVQLQTAAQNMIQELLLVKEIKPFQWILAGTKERK